MKDSAHQTKPAINGLPGHIPAVRGPRGRSSSGSSRRSAREGHLLAGPAGSRSGAHRSAGRARSRNPRGVFRSGSSVAGLEGVPDCAEAHSRGGRAGRPDQGRGRAWRSELCTSPRRATVRFNSILDPADLDSRGVWQWTDELALRQIFRSSTKSVLEGRHWAHPPWREITRGSCRARSRRRAGYRRPGSEENNQGRPRGSDRQHRRDAPAYCPGAAAGRNGPIP